MRTYKITARTGRINAAEIDWMWIPDDIDTSKKPVVLLHGSGAANYSSFVKGANYASCFLGPMAAVSGRQVISGWMGSQHFGNDTFIARYLSALTALGDTSAHILAVSMGNAGGVRAASLHPDKVESLMGVIPIADINAIYQANRLGLRADIGTAWGVTYPAALPAQSNLAVTHGPVIQANGTPVRFLYSTADTATLPAEVTTLAAAIGITPEIVSASDNHTEVSIYNSMNLDPPTPWQDWIDWIDGIDAV